jgi:3-hydroxy-9,10-secoandrosta-1,3,5(10)-triene-9,17-dione monooxygenase reductase component
MTNPPFDTKAFRSALGTFTTGVTIITTTAADGTPVGLTANSFNSVSLDPPLVLWSLAKTAGSVPVFNEATHWNVHILSVDQEPLSGRFASKGEDKFSDLPLDKGISNAPLLKDCTARFQCRSAFSHDGGDHIIYIGEVLNFDQSDLPPLAFQSGQYALTARKPREAVKLTSSQVTPESSYTEDLLGYLIGRAHFQILNKMEKVLNQYNLSPTHFFVLSVLSIQPHLTLEQLNEYVEYTGHKVNQADLDFLISQQLLASNSDSYQLTGEGREVSIHQIAQAKAIEEDIIDTLGAGDVMTLKLLLKRIINLTDPGLPDLWAVKP